MHYDAKKPETERRDGHWHLEKKVPVTLIFSVTILFATQLVVYGANTEKFKNLETQVTDTVSPTTVKEMLNGRDIEIQHIKDDVSEIKDEVKSNNYLLQEILRKLPRD